MDITAILMALAPLGKKLASVLLAALLARSAAAPRREELKRFRDELAMHLECWESLGDKLASSNLSLDALEALQVGIEKFVHQINKLLDKQHLRKGDFKKLKEDVLTTSLCGMTSALLEVLCKVWMELRAQSIKTKSRTHSRSQYVYKTPHGPTTGSTSTLKNVNRYALHHDRGLSRCTVLSRSDVSSLTVERGSSSDPPIFLHRNDALKQLASCERSQKEAVAKPRGGGEFEGNKNENSKYSTMNSNFSCSDFFASKGQLGGAKWHDVRIEGSNEPQPLGSPSSVRAVRLGRYIYPRQNVSYLQVETDPFLSKPCALPGVWRRNY